jgi:uncharacterized protein YegL
MRNDLTDVTVVLDRSGSMQTCREDAEGGLNSFIDEQKKQPGETLFSLVQFDTEYEFVHKGTPMHEVGPCQLVPRGMTALLDAVGRAIVETGERLAAMPEPDRPGLVVFVIVTDGQENSRKEYKKPQIKQMIETQRYIYKWQFTFLGANQDAFAEADSIGILREGTANFRVSKARHAFAAAAGNVGRMRSAAARGEQVYGAFMPEEREAMEEETKKD